MPGLEQGQALELEWVKVLELERVQVPGNQWLPGYPTIVLVN